MSIGKKGLKAAHSFVRCCSLFVFRKKKARDKTKDKKLVSSTEISQFFFDTISVISFDFVCVLQINGLLQKRLTLMNVECPRTLFFSLCFSGKVV